MVQGSEQKQTGPGEKSMPGGGEGDKDLFK